ncbi:MAG: hypothetical protein PHY28_02930 [Dehalococcoidales bacterium]|nr:hypothetical protein [Dehalococcoidales bacterium]
MRTYKRFLAILLAVTLSAIVILTSVLPVLAAAVTVTLSAASGPPATVIYAYGTGFTVPSNYTVTFGTTTVVGATAVPTGGTVTAWFGVPVLTRGVYNVTITTSAGDTTAATIPTFTITPQVFLGSTSGNIGDQVIVSGNGFAASTTITIYFDGIAQTPASAVYSDAYGQFYSAVITVPQSYGGVHTITAGDYGGLSAGASYSITPKMTLSANTGAVGSSITVSGAGFAANSAMSFAMDSTAISVSILTDAYGRFSDVALVVPEVSGGTHTLTAQDASGNALTADFSVSAVMTIGPTTGSVDTNVAVTGKGFLANSNITITFDGASVTTVPASITSDADGGFVTNFKVPAGAAGNHTIIASDTTNTISANFTSSPAPANISPDSGPVGTSITATGSGFKANSKITITYNNVQAGTATTNAKGSFTATFAVPTSSMGAHDLVITDQTNTQKSSFSITPDAKIDPASGSVGSNIAVNGTGFGSSKSVTVKYDADQIASSSTDANGTFTATFKAPVSKGGIHVITVTDGTTTKTFDFAMDSTAPTAPTLVLPANSTRGDKIPTLSWSDVTDPSGVTYTLQVSKDATFSTLILQKEGLTTSSYTFAATETLKSASKKAPYYWRVKAIDGASNESAWANPFSFFMGFTMPSWGWPVIFGVVAVLLGIGGFFLGMRFSRRV